MTIKEVYEKYIERDETLSDKRFWCEGIDGDCRSWNDRALYEFWQAIKQAVEQNDLS